jgi:hypothetical protein
MRRLPIVFVSAPPHLERSSLAYRGKAARLDREAVRRVPTQRLMPGPRGDTRGRDVQGRDGVDRDREGPR